MRAFSSFLPLQQISLRGKNQAKTNSSEHHYQKNIQLSICSKNQTSFGRQMQPMTATCLLNQPGHASKIAKWCYRWGSHLFSELHLESFTFHSKSFLRKSDFVFLMKIQFLGFHIKYTTKNIFKLQKLASHDLFRLYITQKLVKFAYILVCMQRA